MGSRTPDGSKLAEKYRFYFFKIFELSKKEPTITLKFPEENLPKLYFFGTLDLDFTLKVLRLWQISELQQPIYSTAAALSLRQKKSNCREITDQDV